MIKLYGAWSGTPQALLAQALEQAFFLAPLPEIAVTEAGKPFFPALPHCFFNLSHSGPMVLCAVGTVPVGVDVEQVIPRGTSLPQFALSPPEYQEFLRRGGDWPAFYTLWTRRESWCKWTGKGLLAHWKKAPPEHGLSFGEYAGETWRAAVCGQETPPEQVIWLRGKEKDAR